MRIYDLNIVQPEFQSYKSFKAIRYLFLHFQHPSLGNHSNIKASRQRLLVQGLLSFTYHCDHELVSRKAADMLSDCKREADLRAAKKAEDVFSTMSSVID
jgi:hypothetical protein